MIEVFAIDELGPMGDGVHRSAQGRVYIDRALPGDVVRAKIYEGAGGVARADVIQLIDASPHRITAPCVHYDVCGGCTLQHASTEFYRSWKIEFVRTALERKGLAPKHWREPVFLPAGQRRRLTFAAAKKNNVVTLGYFRRRSHQVADITSCLTADPAIMSLRPKLVAALVPILQEGKTADVFIQTVAGRFEIVITGPIGKKGKPDLAVHEAIAQLAQIPGIDRIAWRPREHAEPETMIEAGPLRAKFGALDVALPPLAFMQPTEAGERALVAAVMELLPPTGKFADLFSGCGTFSGPMLERGAVDAFEVNDTSVRALDKAKGGRPLKAAQRDLFRRPLQRDDLGRYDAVVFDPPRAGAAGQARALAASSVPLIVGVSCNPASFAQDARLLVDGGYSLESVKVVDQFTWSHHVELVAAFAR